MLYNYDYLFKQLAQQNQIITSRINALENLLASKGIVSTSDGGGTGSFGSVFANSVENCVNGYCLFGDETNSSGTIDLNQISDEVSFKNNTFKNLINGSFMFANQPLTEIDLSSALFTNVIDTSSMFKSSQLTEIDIPNGTFENLQDASSMFDDCVATKISLPKATFAKVVNTSNMFNNCTNLMEIDLSSSTFEALDFASGDTSVQNMFQGISEGCVVKIPEETYNKLAEANGPFNSGWEAWADGATKKTA